MILLSYLRIRFTYPKRLSIYAIFLAIPEVCLKIHGMLTDVVSEYIVFEISSPDGVWTAQVIENRHESDFITVYVDAVYLKRFNQTMRPIEMLGVDTGGDSNEIPRIVWTSNDTLKVTIFDPESVKVYHYEYDGMELDVHLDPKGPELRAAGREYLKGLDRAETGHSEQDHEGGPTTR